LKGDSFAGKCVAPGSANQFTQVQRTFEINRTLIGKNGLQKRLTFYQQVHRTKRPPYTLKRDLRIGRHHYQK
jgi:hypothetical protein